jgi:hypothetical protein
MATAAAVVVDSAALISTPVQILHYENAINFPPAKTSGTDPIVHQETTNLISFYYSSLSIPIN